MSTTLLTASRDHPEYRWLMLVAAIVGFLFGFIGSMPVAGPIAALVLARSIEGRFRGAVAIAVGGALAEAIYAFLAFWGFAKYLTQYPQVVPASRGVAAVVLIGLGIAFLRAKGSTATPTREEGRKAVGGSFLLGLSITALNPTLIATWSAAATTLFSTGLIEFTPRLAPAFAGGATLGIICWFIVLVWLVRRYRDRFKPSLLVRVLKAMGIFLIAVGLWFAGALIHYLVVS